MSKKFLTLCSAAIAFATASLTADFAIKEGDRVVFLGDSITEQRLYTTYIEAYALSRHPDWKLTFRNVGWGVTPPGCASVHIPKNRNFSQPMLSLNRLWWKTP